MADDGKPLRQPRPFQFGIASILLLTTLGAVVVGIGRALEMPIVGQLGIAAYLFVLLVYAFFRIPYLLRIAFGKDSEWERTQQRRADLEKSYRAVDDDKSPSTS
jgi:hypothetical protein